MGSIAVALSKLSSQLLSYDWQFRDKDSGEEEWLPVTKVPTVVHLDLMDNKKIADPFIGMNELNVEWIGEKSWVYRTSFSTPTIPFSSKCVINFEGLDTIARVELNGNLILESDNMFLSYRVEVTDHLKPLDENTLLIEFESALLRGRDLEKSHPEYNFIAHNGESGRLGVRKAQYHWGWDWGPVLMCAGPWRPIRLEIYSSRIEDLWHNIVVKKDLNVAFGTLFAIVEGSADRVHFSFKLDNCTILEKTVTVGSNGIASSKIQIEEPALWFPHGYGGQPLYTLTAEVFANGVALDTMTKKIGLRRAELIQNEDEIGRSFYFRVNNVDVFCSGSCWIPADSFIPRICNSRYRRWLQMMVDGGQVMTRVWGGGIYEEDIFYDLCDELGILVWQDFMFGCGSYPTWPSLLESIRREATCNVRRLRHHPSIVVYAGNNEDNQVAELHELEYNPKDNNPKSWLKLKADRSTFPARYIYEHLLPDIMAKESPGISYWPSSPFSDGKITSDQTIGDVHQWNVWHGSQEKYQRFDSLGGRFNSEFGMEAFPHIQTIKSFVENPADMYPQSLVLDFHNKADGHERRIAAYLVENFRATTGFQAFIHLTQLSQCEALTFAYRDWRRQWGQKRKCGGALVWQLNDCWPVTSWAIVDYYLRKKPAFYSMARILKPIAIGVRRAHHDWSVCHARPAKTLDYQLWAVSNRTIEVIADMELRFVSVATGLDIKPAVVKNGIIINANGTTDILDGVINNLAEEPHVLAARLWVDGLCVSRDTDWPQPLKYLSFNNRGLQVTWNNDRAHIVVDKPTKGFVFEERDGITLSDSGIDLVPGDEQVVQVQGLTGNERPLTWRYLGQDERLWAP